MSRKNLSERLDSTCCINCLDCPVDGIVAGIGETLCENLGLSEFDGERATAEDESNAVGANSSEVGVLEGTAMDETCCKELKSGNDCETVAPTNGQCGVSR